MHFSLMPLTAYSVHSPKGSKSTVLHIHIFPICLLSAIIVQNNASMGNLNLWVQCYVQDIPVLSHNLVPMKWWKWGFCVSSWTQAESHSSLLNVEREKDRTEREWEIERESEWEINSFLNALCAWPCLLDTTVRLMWKSFRQGGVPESREGHCLLLYIILPPSDHLTEEEEEEEESRRLAAVTHQVMCENLENTLFLIQHTART